MPYGKNKYSNNIGRRYNRVNNRIVKKEPARSRANQIGKYLQYGSTVATIGKTVAMTAKLAGLINIEFKQRYSNIGMSANQTGSLALLNGLAQGTDNDQRIGRSIRMKSVQLLLTNTQNASATNSLLRYILFIDKQPTGVAPTVAELISTPGGGSAYYGMRNLDNKKRFVILKDQWVTMNSGTNNEIGVFEYYKKLDMHTVYDSSNAGTIADISSNALYLLALSNEVANPVSVTGSWRVRFLDD